MAAAAALSMLAGVARADHEHVHVAQASNGHLIATLSGDFLPCGAFAFIGSPVIVADPVPPPVISIESTVAFSSAPCPSPPPVTSIPYSVSVDLGARADGTEQDAWRLTGDISALIPFTFTVVGGVLVGGPPEPVPALGSRELALLALLLALSGAWIVRSGQAIAGRP